MDADTLHRLTKLLMDSGEAATLAQAQAQFAAFGVRVVIGKDALDDPSNRIIAMTVLNVAARTFQGQVAIEGPRDAIVDEGAGSMALGQFAQWLGIGVDQVPSNWPTICIGLSATASSQNFIAPWASGWRFGLGPAPQTGPVFAPASVAAGALAVNEAFSFLRKDNPYAGRRTISMSLWDPSNALSDGPSHWGPLPGLWLVGLGHLGQAYAWILGLMKAIHSAPLYLQDVDLTTSSTVSTSILTTSSDIGQRKSRVVASWLEARGQPTCLVERRFDEFQRVGANEPRLALFGVDNPTARRHIEGAGFRLTIDAGLGAGYRDFRGIRVRSFPGPSRAAALWAPGNDQAVAPLAPAYRDLLANGADACGVAMLASRAVGAPFVGCVAAAFVVSELVRYSLGAHRFGVIDLNLRQPQMVDFEIMAEA